MPTMYVFRAWKAISKIHESFAKSEMSDFARWHGLIHASEKTQSRSFV